MHLQGEQVAEAAKPKLEVGERYHLPLSIHYSGVSRRVRGCGPGDTIRRGDTNMKKLINRLIFATEEKLKVIIPR